MTKTLRSFHGLYQEGIRKKVKVDLGDISIYIFHASYFVASKMEAFLGRGAGDLFASHDLEDIIYLLDHRSTSEEELLSSPPEVKAYLFKQFNNLRKQPLFEEALLGHVEQQDTLDRVRRIMALLRELK